jgi:hypothetical protein
MKGSIFWDITPCSPLKVKRRFGGTHRLHLQDRRICQARNKHEAGRKQSCDWPILWSWRWRRYVPPKRRLAFNELHDILSQKTELFITTALRTSNPIYLYFVCNVMTYFCVWWTMTYFCVWWTDRQFKPWRVLTAAAVPPTPNFPQDLGLTAISVIFSVIQQ